MYNPLPHAGLHEPGQAVILYILVRCKHEFHTRSRHNIDHGIRIMKEVIWLGS